MKLIVAYVRPEQLSEVLEQLFHAEVRGLTISRVQGHGGEIEHVENYRGTSVKMALAEKVRIEIGVSVGHEVEIEELHAAILMAPMNDSSSAANASAFSTSGRCPQSGIITTFAPGISR